jgi:hypothetical protein
MGSEDVKASASYKIDNPILHFEQRRIVIDVAGRSPAITDIYERLHQFFAEVHAPDGSPIIGEPEHIVHAPRPFVNVLLPTESSHRQAPPSTLDSA